jgi:nucleotide-binding universal stress UspA family protein
MAENHPQSVRRILVAIDASRESLAALKAAVRVAERLHAELAGVFVEDIDLVNLAALPFAREFGVGRPARKLDSEAIEQDLRAQAAAARRALAEAAEAMRLPWSFRVARGRVEAELLAAALEADLIALGKAMRPLTRRARLGSTARSLAAGAHSAVLIAAAEARGRAEQIMVTFDGSECADRAMEIAARLAQNDGGDLTVFILAGAEKSKRTVSDRLSGSGLNVTFREVIPEGLGTALEQERGGFLVLGADCLPDEAGLASLIEAAHCPVLLLRPERHRQD